MLLLVSSSSSYLLYLHVFYLFFPCQLTMRKSRPSIGQLNFCVAFLQEVSFFLLHHIFCFLSSVFLHPFLSSYEATTWLLYIDLYLFVLLFLLFCFCFSVLFSIVKYIYLLLCEYSLISFQFILFNYWIVSIFFFFLFTFLKMSSTIYLPLR